MPSRLERFASRVKDDPYFLASALQTFASCEELDDISLAERLGCSRDTLPLIRLCRRPEKSGPGFRADVERIATRYMLDRPILAEIVRRADAIEAMTGRVPGRGLLMAARDRSESGDHPREVEP